MKKFIKIVIIVFVVAILVTFAVLLYFIFRPNPYCDPTLCRPGQKHIGCYFLEWGPDCEDPEIIKITSDMEKSIIELHNELRNNVAEGKLLYMGQVSYGMADRMGALSWDDDLAYLAKVNTYQCKMKHDECRNTKEFKYSGQNLGFGSGPKDPAKFMLNIIRMWYNEFQTTKIDELKKYKSPPKSDKRQNGHFTVMANDRQTNVGCGLSTTLKKGSKFLLFACNYSYTNMVGSAVYKPATSGKPCNGCKKGCHPSYPFLCAEGEDIPLPK